MLRLSVRGRYAVPGHDRLGAFVLRIAAGSERSVRIRVQQLAPTCRDLGTIVRRVRAGQTRLRVPSRIDGRALEPGTYLLDVASGRSVVVAVFAERPTTAKVRAQLRENTCDVSAVSAAAAAKAFRFDRVRLLPPPTAASSSTDGGAGTRGESGHPGAPDRVHVASAVTGETASRRNDSLFEIPPGAAAGIGSAAAGFDVGELAIALVAIALVLLVAAVPATAISHGRAAHVVTRSRVLNAFVVVTGAVIASVLTVLLLLFVGL